MPKVKKIKRQSNVDYSTGPAFSAKSKSRQAVDKMYDAKGGTKSGLKSKLVMDSEGNYIRKSVDSSPAKTPSIAGSKYDKGGKMKAKKDACYHKVKAAEIAAGNTWPSAYASGRLAKCRKMGAGNYGKKK